MVEYGKWLAVEPGVWKCDKCGNQIKPRNIFDHEYCFKCGMRMTEVENATQERLYQSIEEFKRRMK